MIEAVARITRAVRIGEADIEHAYAATDGTSADG